MDIADLGQKVGVDIYSHTTDAGGGIENTVRLLLAYFTEQPVSVLEW